MTTCAAGTRCRILGLNFTVNTATSTIALLCRGTTSSPVRENCLTPSEVLTAAQRERLAQAATSDATVMIRTPSEVGDPTGRPTHDGEQTWHFLMRNTRDVAFAASPAFVWDAARINLPDDRHALAMSVYPPEAAGRTTGSDRRNTSRPGSRNSRAVGSRIRGR